ncbi:MAG: hypothetical protein ACD_22C00084G0003 [uncultured bacterium]|nr:MAG: hypothetical protein ACD_22C00084G0003 [uncultured bacterium]
MTKIDVFDIKGNSVEQMSLSKEVFGIEPNEEALKQYIRVYQNNQRQGTSSTKTRGEVSGGGIKPWKQKGTGRARVGSSRNPIWRHGGISHGPKPKDWSLKLPKQVKRLAILSALSMVATTENKMKVLDKLELKTPKTKTICEMLKKLDLGYKTLIVLGSVNENVMKSIRNIENVSFVNADSLNAYEVMNARKVLFLKDAVKSLEKKYETK